MIQYHKNERLWSWGDREIEISGYIYQPHEWRSPTGHRRQLLDYLLDIAALSELEAQAFRYTRNNIC